jgi:hypothetical protein
VYDVYLDIQRHVNLQIWAALCYDTPNYQLLNACPPCFYRLEDEPKLKYSFFCSVDGNNSLKQMGAEMHNTTTCLDSHSILSDHWLTPQEVNLFADEVEKKLVSCDT